MISTKAARDEAAEAVARERALRATPAAPAHPAAAATAPAIPNPAATP
jgi:hypothetical protein